MKRRDIFRIASLLSLAILVILAGCTSTRVGALKNIQDSYERAVDKYLLAIDLPDEIADASRTTLQAIRDLKQVKNDARTYVKKTKEGEASLIKVYLIYLKATNLLVVLDYKNRKLHVTEETLEFARKFQKAAGDDKEIKAIADFWFAKVVAGYPHKLSTSVIEEAILAIKRVDKNLSEGTDEKAAVPQIEQALKQRHSEGG